MNAGKTGEPVPRYPPLASSASSSPPNVAKAPSHAAADSWLVCVSIVCGGSRLPPRSWAISELPPASLASSSGLRGHARRPSRVSGCGTERARLDARPFGWREQCCLPRPPVPDPGTLLCGPALRRGSVRPGRLHRSNRPGGTRRRRQAAAGAVARPAPCATAPAQPPGICTHAMPSPTAVSAWEWGRAANPPPPSCAKPPVSPAPCPHSQLPARHHGVGGAPHLDEEDGFQHPRQPAPHAGRVCVSPGAVVECPACRPPGADARPQRFPPPPKPAVPF